MRSRERTFTWGGRGPRITRDLSISRSPLQPRVLIASSRSSLRRNATRATISIGCKVAATEMDRQSVAGALTEPVDMLIFDADDPMLIDLLSDETVDFGDAPILLMSSRFVGDELYEILSRRGINNLIARHGVSSAGTDLIDEHELIATCYKIFSGDIFGVEKYLGCFGAKVHEAVVTSVIDKTSAIQELHQFLESLLCQPRTIQKVLMVADELLMNAIYCAPCDRSGSPKYLDMIGTGDLVLESGERVDFRYACDGRSVALSVGDRFGRLERSKVFRYLKSHFYEERAEMEEKVGGAGLGLHMVFGAATQLVFNIEPGLQTEVIATFYLHSGHRSLRQSAKSLNVFVAPGDLRGR